MPAIRQIDELEAGLRRSFDRAHLEVYADALQATGDPRGELIVIDLDADLGKTTPEHTERRRELVARMLPAHSSIQLRHGFVEIGTPTNLDAIDAVLLGPLGSYVRMITIAGPAKQIRRAITTLALRERPWLDRMIIRQGDPGYVQLSRELTIALVEATPRLELLDVIGRRLFPLVPHPSIGKLIAAPFDALAALLATGNHPACLPNVTDLDYLFGVNYQGLPPEQTHELLPSSQLPALRRLDLTRNLNLHAGLDLFRIIERLDIAVQLDYLRVPAVRHVEQALRLQAALDRMQNLVELEVVDAYHPTHVLHHPSAKITLPRKPRA